MNYTEIDIYKKGKVRRVYKANPGLDNKLRKELPSLNALYLKLIKDSIIENTTHGFIKGRNVITAAEQHINFDATIMLDITNFFGSVSRGHLEYYNINKEIFFVDSFLAQGFCTSPILANIASIDLISDIKRKLELLHIKYAFTIYADDIQISINKPNKEILEEVIIIVSVILEKHNFKLSEKKTRVKYLKYGWKRILGVNVGRTEVRATRKTMRKIRAAEHQGNYESVGGLVNWSNCNKPKVRCLSSIKL